MVWIELCVLLACILVGARLGGIGLGTVAGLGLVVLVFIFGLPPGMPPRTVLGMIVAVVTAAATMQAAGGLNYLAAVADRALRVWPGGITIIAPLVTYFVTFAAGTVHIVYALLPVIAEVSRKAGIRPERPLSIATIAAQQAITASPISAATVALLALLTPQGVQLQQILLICVPATLLGSLIGALAVLRKGPELEDDPTYKERLAQGLVRSETSAVNLTGKELSRARGSVIVFLLAAVLVVVLGLFPSLRPTYAAASGGQESVEQLDMAPAIMIMMFAAAGINMLLFRASAAETIKTSIMSAGHGRSHFDRWPRLAGIIFLRRQQAIDRWKHFWGDPTAFVGFRPRVVRFVYPAGKPGSNRGHVDACCPGTGVGRPHLDRDVSSRQRIFLFTDLRDNVGGHFFRSNRHHAYR